MKAIVYDHYGSPEILRLEEVPKPSPGNGEVLVRVHAASVNSWDWDLLKGSLLNRLTGGFRTPQYRILGADIAGRVEATGSDVTGFQPDDEVFGDLSGCGWGGFAEYVCADHRAVRMKPAAITFEEAAAVPQASVLALQGIQDDASVQPGQHVLINGAGGGVGTFAVQLAKSAGAEVTGVDSAGKLDLIRSIGADLVIDYIEEDYTRNRQQYDLIFDTAGYHSVFDARKALTPTGSYVMVGGSTARIVQVMLLGALISRTSDQKMGILVHEPNKNLAYIGELLETGVLTPVIDRRYRLDQVPDALRYFGSGQVQGKVIITMDDTP